MTPYIWGPLFNGEPDSTPLIQTTTDILALTSAAS